MAALNTRVDAMTLRFGLLGGSLPHTLSPQIHNTLFDARMLNAIYLSFPVTADVLPSAMEVLRQNFSGFNVTIPYKEAVLPYLDELSELASACGAVNTIVVGERGDLVGHNTDGEGLLSALTEAFLPSSDAEVLLLGAGGTARVAAHMLLGRGCSLTLAVRTPEKGEALREALAAHQKDGGRRIRVTRIEDLPYEEDRYDLLVNTTPVGMYPHGDTSPVPEGVVARCEGVFDAVYNPPETQLMSLANALDIKCAGGFGMLFHQAVEAQRLWFGKAPQAKVLRELRRDLATLV